MYSKRRFHCTVQCHVTRIIVNQSTAHVVEARVARVHSLIGGSLLHKYHTNIDIFLVRPIKPLSDIQKGKSSGML